MYLVRPVFFNGYSCLHFERRSVFAFLSFAMLIALVSCGSREGQTEGGDGRHTENNQRPNVVWILLDTLRSDHLGAYGYERDTSPNIDRLAERGVLFERHFSQGPNTLLSVPTYFSGKYFPVFLQDEFHLDVWFLKEKPEDEILASELFSQNGYATGMFSSSPWYSAASRMGSSFDYFSSLASPDLVTTGDFRAQNPGVFEWIEENKEGPFFAYIHTLDAHEPYGELNTRDTWLDKDFPSGRESELRLWTGAPFSGDDQEYLQGLYDGGVAYADYTVGEILGHLDALGVLDNTVVIISSDHGELLGSDGTTLGHPSKGISDELFRVPFVAAGPGLPEGARFSQGSQNVDILPTIAELVNLDHDALFDGASLMPIITGQKREEVHSFVYSKSEHTFFTAEPRHLLHGESEKYTIGSTHTGKRVKTSAQLESELEVLSLSDSVGSRDTTDQSVSEVKRAVEYLEEVIIPAWDRYVSLPESVPARFQLPLWEKVIEDIFTKEFDSADGLWTRKVQGNMFTPSSSVRYIAFNESERVPRLDGVRPIPNGRYRVSLRAMTHAVDGVQRACSFRFGTGQPGETQSFRLEPESASEPTVEWIELGEFDITDGLFKYRISQGHPSDVTVVGGLRFEDLNRDSSPEVDTEQIDEELRSLGYVN